MIHTTSDPSAGIPRWVFGRYEVDEYRLFGQVIAQGTAAEIRVNEAAVNAYLGSSAEACAPPSSTAAMSPRRRRPSCSSAGRPQP